MSDNLFYLLRLEAKKVAVEVRVNDVPLIDHLGQADLSMTAQVNHLIIKGSNGVRLVVRPADKDKAPPSDASVALTLREAKQGQTVDEARELIRREWTMSGHAAEAQQLGQEPAKFPAVRNDATPISGALGDWRWLSAPPVVLSPAVDQQLRQRVSKIHAALAIRNDHELVPLMGIRHEEIGRAFGRPRAEMDEGFRKALRAAFRDKQWGMTPLDPTSLRLDLVGGGRIVWVRGPESGEALRSRVLSSGGELKQQLMFSKIDGEWVIVR